MIREAGKLNFKRERKTCEMQVTAIRSFVVILAATFRSVKTNEPSSQGRKSHYSKDWIKVRVSVSGYCKTVVQSFMNPRPGFKSML